MSARIRSTVNEIPGGPQVGAPLSEASRDDLRRGNEVVLESLDTATTYAWTIADSPADETGAPSVATLLAPEGSTGPVARFVVDNEGSYLLRLVVDQGLPTESTQFVRLRYLTRFGGMKLVAAGERRDETGTVPVDASAKGWSLDQNENVNRMVSLLRRASTSGRILYVDANRGRDYAANSDDPTNTFTLPDSEIELTAEKHGDFSTIGDAISYVLNYAARGESAPSEDEPWIIRVRPGLYVEDVTFYPYIHVYGDSSLQWDSFYGGAHDVVLRTANAAGGTHAYNGTGMAGCQLANLRLENTDNATTTPVLDINGGLITMFGCAVVQEGTGGTVGPCVDVAHAVNPVYFSADHSTFIHYADNSDDDTAIRVDTPQTAFVLNECHVSARRTCLLVNPRLFEMATGGVTVLRSEMSSENGIPVRAYGDQMIFQDSTFFPPAGSGGVTFDFSGFGGAPGSKAGDVTPEIHHCTVDGQIRVDDSQAAGTVQVRTSGLIQAKWTSPPTPFLFTTGTPDVVAWQPAYSTAYYGDWQGYDGNDLSPAVPAPAQLDPNSTVQLAIDTLLNLVMPLGISPFYSLSTAYDGLVSPNPIVLGAGLGRAILADDGAVQITGAVSPLVAGIDPDLNGGLQVEGRLDLGPLAVDGLGSEISISPNTFGFGPILRMGRAVYPSGYVGLRPFPSSLIVAGAQDGAATEDDTYHLRMRSKDKDASNQGGLGNVYIQAGSRVDSGNVDVVGAGNVYIQAGNQLVAGQVPGDIVLAPGAESSGGHGSVVLAEVNTATACTLTAALAFPGPLSLGGGGGTLVLQTDDGTVFAPTFSDGDDLATVVNTINTSCDGKVIASDFGGFLRLTTASLGPPADVGVVGDMVPAGAPGDLLVALGELRVGSGATWGAGTFVRAVELDCPANSILNVSGAILQEYAHTTTDLIVTSEAIVGVDTATGGVALNITLPTPMPGRRVTIKDEVGNAFTDNINVLPSGLETIDGNPSFTMVTDYAALTVYSDGTNWFII